MRNDHEKWEQEFFKTLECPECESIMFQNLKRPHEFSCSSGTCGTEVRITTNGLKVLSRQQDARALA